MGNDGGNWGTTNVAYVAEPVRDVPRPAEKSDHFTVKELSVIWFLAGGGLMAFTWGAVPGFGIVWIDVIAFAICAGAVVFFLAEQAPEYRRTLRSYLGMGAMALTIAYAMNWSLSAWVARMQEEERQAIERMDPAERRRIEEMFERAMRD
jgi:hypothetical protein